jgi:hypothetical protein
LPVKLARVAVAVAWVVVAAALVVVAGAWVVVSGSAVVVDVAGPILILRSGPGFDSTETSDLSSVFPFQVSVLTYEMSLSWALDACPSTE